MEPTNGTTGNGTKTNEKTPKGEPIPVAALVVPVKVQQLAKTTWQTAVKQEAVVKGLMLKVEGARGVTQTAMLALFRVCGAEAGNVELGTAMFMTACTLAEQDALKVSGKTSIRDLSSDWTATKSKIIAVSKALGADTLDDNGFPTLGNLLGEAQRRVDEDAKALRETATAELKAAKEKAEKEAAVAKAALAAKEASGAPVIPLPGETTEQAVERASRETAGTQDQVQARTALTGIVVGLRPNGSPIQLTDKLSASLHQFASAISHLHPAAMDAAASEIIDCIEAIEKVNAAIGAAPDLKALVGESATVSKAKGAGKGKAAQQAAA